MHIYYVYLRIYSSTWDVALVVHCECMRYGYITEWEFSVQCSVTVTVLMTDH